MRQKTFTLIELLVVIAVISILTAMLLPSLMQAKRKARQITVQNNMGQMIKGFIMGADDKDGYLPESMRIEGYGCELMQVWKSSYYRDPDGVLFGGTWNPSTSRPGIDLMTPAREYGFMPATEHPIMNAPAFDINWPEGLELYENPGTPTETMNRRGYLGSGTYMSWQYYPGYHLDFTPPSGDKRVIPTGPVRVSAGADYWMMSEFTRRYASGTGQSAEGINGDVSGQLGGLNPSHRYIEGRGYDMQGTYGGGYDGHVEWIKMANGTHQERMTYYHWKSDNWARMAPQQPHTPDGLANDPAKFFIP